MCKERRFCKGCELDVTDTMWCSCGDEPLNDSSTFTEKDLIRLESSDEKLEQPNV